MIPMAGILLWFYTISLSYILGIYSIQCLLYSGHQLREGLSCWKIDANAKHATNGPVCSFVKDNLKFRSSIRNWIKREFNWENVYLYLKIGPVSISLKMRTAAEQRGEGGYLRAKVNGSLMRRHRPALSFCFRNGNSFDCGGSCLSYVCLHNGGGGESPDPSYTYIICSTIRR